MDTVGDVLTLLYTARQRLSSIQVTVRTRHDVARAREAHDRWTAQIPWTAQQSPESVAMLTEVDDDWPLSSPPPIGWVSRLWAALHRRPVRWPAGTISVPTSPGGKQPPLSAYVEWESRLWMQSPSRWRYEGGPWGSPHSTIVRDEPSERSPDPPDFPDPMLTYMLDPVGIIPELWLEPLGRGVQAGREGIRVRGLPRIGPMEDARLEMGDISPSVLWLGADEYDVLVDAEHGVLLRCAASMDGEEFNRTEIVSVVFDGPIPDSLLSSSPRAE